MPGTRQKAAGVSKLKDRRVRRTRAHLTLAFAELLLLRSYESIRVTDITRRADVGRATFYSHYSGKKDLLRAELRRLFGSLLVARLDLPGLLDSTALFSHLKQGHRVYRSLMRGTSRPLVSAIMRSAAEERVVEILAHSQCGKPNAGGMPASLVARFVADTLLGLIDWWEERDMRHSPDEMQAAFGAFVGGGVGAAIVDG